MRQAGIVAAAGVYALDHHVERLADDHARARRLAEALHAAGLPVDLEQVETNFVQVDLAPLGLERDEALARLREAGVGLSATIHPTVLRAVTHLGVSDEDVERAVELVPRALGGSARRLTLASGRQRRARQPARGVPDAQLGALRCGDVRGR